MSLSRLSFKQAINFPGLRAFSRVISNPRIAVPNIEACSVADLDFSKLKEEGITCLVFDKDNTLSLAYIDELHPSLVEAMKAARKSFGSNSLAILSNSVGTADDRNYVGAEATERGIGLPVIRHTLKKPACLMEVVAHFEHHLGRKVDPRELCMIGDRLLTDVVFANLNGMRSVLVSPISIKEDHPIAVIIRVVERRLILPLIKTMGFKAY